MTTNDNTSNEAPTPVEEREYLLEALGMARANFRTLASLVTAGEMTAARAMIRAVKAGDAEDEGAGFRADNVGGETRLTGWVVRHLALALADHLDALPAPNHCAWSINFPAEVDRPARMLDVVAQWVGGETTAERLGRAERERDEARAEVALWRGDETVALFSAAAAGALPRCDCWHGCSRLATREATEGDTAWLCDECHAAHESVANERRARGGWRDLPHAAAIRAAMGAK